MHVPHHFRRLAAGLASLGAGLALAGCGAGPEAPDGRCADIADREAEHRALIINLGKEIEAGTTADDGALALQERAWADLVLGDTQCFSAEKVAVAPTILQARRG